MRVGNVSRPEFQEHSPDPDRNFRITVRTEKRYQDSIRSDGTARLGRMGIGPERYVDIQASRTREPIPAGGELRHTPTYEPTHMEFLEFLAKRFNCKRRRESSDRQGSAYDQLADTASHSAARYKISYLQPMRAPTRRKE